MVWQQPVTVKPLPRTVTVYTCARKRSSFEKETTSYRVLDTSTLVESPRRRRSGVSCPSSPKDAHRCHPGNRTWRQKISSISSVASPGEDYPFSPQQGAMMAAWRALRFQEYRLSLLPSMCCAKNKSMSTSPTVTVLPCVCLLLTARSRLARAHPTLRILLALVRALQHLDMRARKGTSSALRSFLPTFQGQMTCGKPS